MIQSILLIRIKQTGRIINDLGLLRFLFVAFLLTNIIFLAYMATNNHDGSIIISLLAALSIFLLHINRSDTKFLKTQVDKYTFLQITEYLICLLPVLLGLTVHWEPVILLLLVSSIVIITLIARPFRLKTINFFIQKHIPDSNYEWKAGIRKNFYWLILTWVSSITTCFWLGSIPVAILIFGLITVGFTGKNEPLQYILSFEKPPLLFVKHKISAQLILYTIPLIPLISLFLLLHTGYWYLAVLPYLIILFIHTYAILCKYSFYTPNTRSGGQPFNMLGIISVLLPFLLPLVIILTIRFYFRSIQNLKQYLYDYH
ncbi:MAG TPA: hypothetical protein VK172_13110 [Lentimicrobium sp.]|nr:hypothetical protein [Lentimicrobium sp.]